MNKAITLRNSPHTLDHNVLLFLICSTSGLVFTAVSVLKTGYCYKGETAKGCKEERQRKEKNKTKGNQLKDVRKKYTKKKKTLQRFANLSHRLVI